VSYGKDERFCARLQDKREAGDDDDDLGGGMERLMADSHADSDWKAQVSRNGLPL
jgi:hypothetical protein